MTATTGTIATVNPTQLTIAMNVRTDVKLDPDFVASVKTHGILQPPMVSPNDDGGYDVILGQRRTLAAVEAGLTEIPVYVVTRDAADAARIIDQLTENEQRSQLTDAERIGGYKELALFGITPAQIAKRTNTPRTTIDKALAVGNAPAAESAITDHGITLDQAAIIADFTDPVELAELIKTAAANPAQLEHVAARIIRTREINAALKQVITDLEQRGITVLPTDGYWEAEGYRRLEGLAHPDTPTVALTIEQVPTEHLAARAEQRNRWDDNKTMITEAVATYFVTSIAADRDYVRKIWAPPADTLTPEEREERDARNAAIDAAREARQARITALAEAADVRTTFLRENLLQRPKQPDFAPLMTSLLLAGDYYVGFQEDIDDILALLQITIEPDTEDDEVDVFDHIRHLASTDPKLKARIAFAAVLQLGESITRAHWDVLDTQATYLEQLTAWGYTPSTAEQALITEASSS